VFFDQADGFERCPAVNLRSRPRTEVLLDVWCLQVLLLLLLLTVEQMWRRWLSQDTYARGCYTTCMHNGFVDTAEASSNRVQTSATRVLKPYPIPLHVYSRSHASLRRPGKRLIVEKKG
jgi:hypothetical protein